MVLSHGDCRARTIPSMMPNGGVGGGFDKSHSYTSLRVLTDGERKIKGGYKKETKMKPKLGLQESTTEH